MRARAACCGYSPSWLSTSRWVACLRDVLDSKLCGGEAMKATQKLHELGQSVWLDNITRDLLTSGTLKRYIADLSLTGLTSNPTIFDHAIKNSSHYDSAIRSKLA